MEAETGKGSLFDALRRAQEPPPAAATPAAQGPSLRPVLERLEKIEIQLTSGPGAEAEKRMAALEAQLKATQEQAIAALVSLREREAAQKAAQSDAETLMRELSAQRRGEEADRQMRGQVAAQRARIDELEARLLAAGSGRLDPVLAAQRVLALKVAAFQDRLERIAEQFAVVGKAQAAVEPSVSALHGEVARVAREGRARESAAAAAAEAAGRRAAELAAELERLRVQAESDRKAAGKGEAELAAAESRLEAKLAAALDQRRAEDEADALRRRQAEAQAAARADASASAVEKLREEISRTAAATEARLEAKLAAGLEQLRAADEAQAARQSQAAAQEAARADAASSAVEKLREEIARTAAATEALLEAKLAAGLDQLREGARAGAAAADSLRAFLLKRVDEVFGRAADHEALIASAMQESRDRQKAWEERVAGELARRLRDGSREDAAKEAAAGRDEARRALAAEAAALRSEMAGLGERLKASRAADDESRARELAASLAELKVLAARREESGEGRLAALRGDLAALAQDWETSAAELRAELEAQREALGAVDKAVRGLREGGAEELRLAEEALAQLREEAKSWRRTDAAQAEVLARFERFKTELEERSKRMGEQLGRFETEARGLILGRILRLEEKLK